MQLYFSYICDDTHHLVAFYDMLGIRRTHSRLDPGPNGGRIYRIPVTLSVSLKYIKKKVGGHNSVMAKVKNWWKV